jgi:hypothetical protein
LRPNRQKVADPDDNPLILIFLDYSGFQTPLQLCRILLMEIIGGGVCIALSEISL